MLRDHLWMFYAPLFKWNISRNDSFVYLLFYKSIQTYSIRDFNLIKLNILIRNDTLWKKGICFQTNNTCAALRFAAIGENNTL